MTMHPCQHLIMIVIYDKLQCCHLGNRWIV